MPEIRPYDFSRPPRSVESLPQSLDLLLQRFAEGFARSLGEPLRASVEVEFHRVEMLRYADFIGSRTVCACLCVLRVDPPGVHAIIELSPPAISTMIDRLLCVETSPEAIAARSLTHIERILAWQIVERAGAQLADTFSMGESVAVRAEELICEAAPPRLMPADEMVTAAQFAVRVNDGGGSMSLCIPQPLLQHLLMSDAPAHDPQADERNLRANVLRAPVEVRVLLAETKLRASDVISIEVGDIITTTADVDSAVPLQVQGRTKFVGHAAQLRGQRAIEITSPTNGSGE